MFPPNSILFATKREPAARLKCGKWALGIPPYIKGCWYLCICNLYNMQKINMIWYTLSELNRTIILAWLLSLLGLNSYRSLHGTGPGRRAVRPRGMGAFRPRGPPQRAPAHGGWVGRPMQAHECSLSSSAQEEINSMGHVIHT